MIITWDIILISIGVLFAHLLILYFVTKKKKDIRGRHVVVTGKYFVQLNTILYLFIFGDKRKKGATIIKGQLIVLTSYRF